MDEKFIWTFGLVMQNVSKMLADRGYSLLLENESPLVTFGKVYKISKEKNISLAEAASISVTEYQTSKTIKVVYLDRNYDFLKRKDKMISTDQLKVVPQDVNIIVAPFKLSPKAKKVFVNEAEIFSFDDLIYDIPRHKLYMPHTVVSLKTLTAMVKAKPDELPKLLRTDAVVRWFGFSSGSIVRIERPEGVIFRCVE